MRIFALATLSAALVVAVPAGAKTQSDSDQPTAGQSADKKVCKKLKVTGSRMSDRVCMTASEWKKVEEQK
jgi:hypothetical protein